MRRAVASSASAPPARWHCTARGEQDFIANSGARPARQASRQAVGGLYAASANAGRGSVQVPEDVDHALDVLAQLGGMFEGTVNLPQEPDTKKSRAEIASILANLIN